MCRLDIPDSEGMLFLYNTLQTSLNFWMFNTHSQLDILYIREDGSVDSFRTMEPCIRQDGEIWDDWYSRCRRAADAGGYGSDGPAIAALELPGGWLERNAAVMGEVLAAKLVVDWEAL